VKLLLGKRLKEFRGKRTQQDIADKLGISRARYSHYENDHVQPDNDLLQKMADLHNTTVDFLLGREVTFLDKVKKGEGVAEQAGTYSPENAAFFEAYIKLPEERKRIVDGVIRALLDERKNEKE
jgi:transcriptional regulator with XRE-family HTH domain